MDSIDPINFINSINPINSINKEYKSNYASYSDCLSSQTLSDDDTDVSGYISGATVLGNSTDQYFDNVDPLTNIDTNNITRINLRLVISKQPRYISVSNAMKNKTNSIPPRINDNYIRQINDNNNWLNLFW